MNVLISPDKFKGSLTAEAAAEAISRGWRKARPDDRLTLLPITDGGDGFGEAMSRLLKARVRRIQTIDAARRRCSAEWWWEKRSKTAIIESARTIGLALLPPGRFHPFDLDTFGLGAAVHAAERTGAVRCVIGIGGSATNDGGFGLARALGWQFLDGAGRSIDRWTDLRRLAKIQPPSESLIAGSNRRHVRRASEFVVAVDVRNPLLGSRGATRIYGPQKGLRFRDFAHAEACLRQMALVVKRQLGFDFAKTPGAGAAGGLGFGLMTFLGARAESGFDLFARAARLNQRLRSAHLVVTGEGSIDRSTLMGKGVGRIMHRCRELEIPCIGLAGVVEVSTRQQRAFGLMRALTELTSVNQAKAKAAYWLERLAKETGETMRL